LSVGYFLIRETIPVLMLEFLVLDNVASYECVNVNRETRFMKIRSGISLLLTAGMNLLAFPDIVDRRRKPGSALSKATTRNLLEKMR
jgi:hypothetical protein